VYFRGQLRPVPQKVNVYLQPDIVWAQPKPPPTAGVAVRADPEIHQRNALSRGAIAIVLDCSGSMAPWYGYNLPPDQFPAPYRAYRNKTYMQHFGGKLCKYHEATKALDGLLRELPKGVQVSVTVFSDVPTDNDGQPVEGPDERAGGKAENTVKMIRPPSAWDP